MKELEIFQSMLASHDWFYTMSEDKSVYLKGKQEAEKIKNYIKILENNNFGLEAKEIYNYYLNKYYNSKLV